MTDLQKKEIWVFSFISFAYVLSLLLSVMDRSMFDIGEVSQAVLILKLITAIVVIGIVGLFYFYLFPRYYTNPLNTNFILIVFGCFIAVLFAISFYHYHYYIDYYYSLAVMSKATRHSLVTCILLTLFIALYHQVKLIVIDYYQRIGSSIVKKEFFEKTLIVALVILIGSIVVLFFRIYIHRVWIASIYYIVPTLFLYYTIGLNYVYPKFTKEKKKFRLFLRILFIIFLLGFPAVILFVYQARFIDHTNEAIFILFSSLAAVGVWLITKLIYNDIIKRVGALGDLQLQVNTTTANIDFLRSQINPHFLFNALNTLYGLALTENGERTAEGIQKLGDMMRFMLLENNQPKISLDKEINYISHYIDLQTLRTQASDNITIQFNKDSHEFHHSIAPMLLIPLIENAFKHGISLTQKSWITINLSCDEKKIYLDVYNSVHQKKEMDTEKESHGIGLANVQQRLSLLYPNKHELQIRNTPHEYIVHLTIEP